MKTRIFIVSYSKDIPYLELNLKTIKRFATGFSGITLVVPAKESALFGRLAIEHGVELRAYSRTPDLLRWHLAAQAQKSIPDLYCPEDDYIFHTDSDCIFTCPASPNDYFVDGKPVMLFESYSRIRDCPWKSVTEAVLKQPVEFEFMRRHPQINPVKIYKDLRDHIAQLHGMGFQDFVESRKPDFPWGYTEHNIIGAYAYYHPEWHERYHWHNVETDGFPPEKLMQFWSYSGVDEPQEISHGGIFTPRQFTCNLLQ